PHPVQPVGPPRNLLKEVSRQVVVVFLLDQEDTDRGSIHDSTPPQRLVGEFAVVRQRREGDHNRCRAHNSRGAWPDARLLGVFWVSRSGGREGALPQNRSGRESMTDPAARRQRRTGRKASSVLTGREVRSSATSFCSTIWDGVRLARGS